VLVIPRSVSGTDSKIAAVVCIIKAGSLGSSVYYLIEALKNALKNLDPNDSASVDSALEVVKSIDVENLAYAMQSRSSALELIAELEDAYLTAHEDIIVDTVVDQSLQEMGFNGENIKITGAGLNATGGSVTFSFESSTADVTVNENFCKNQTRINISLSGAGVDSEQLTVPVTITMLLPARVDPEKLLILQYTDADDYTLRTPQINSDGTVSFTLTHFSEFVFAEAVGADALMLGNVSGTGTIGMQDVLLIYQCYRGKITLGPEQIVAANVNGDSSIDMRDVLLMYQYYRGKIASFV
jgi:hypothetical protein